MVKVLRKNRQWAMGIFGVLLMVTFLLNPASNRLFGGDESTRTVALINKEKVTGAQAQQASKEYESLKAFVPEFIQIMGGPKGIENSTHWMLLAREAERAGLVGEAGDGLDWINEISEGRLAQQAQISVLQEAADNPGLYNLLRQNTQFRRQIASQKLSDPKWVEEMQPQVRAEVEREMMQAANKTGLLLTEFHKTLAKLRGVARLIDTYTQASARMSDRTMLAGARRYLEEADVSAVIIEAQTIASEIPDPAPERVQAQYDTYRTVAPGTGEFGFGYVQPRRVKLEWMGLTRADVANAVAIDPVAVQKQYQLNRAAYPGDFATEKPKVEKAIKDTKVDEVLSQFDALYKARLKAATRRLESDGGSRKLPADWDTQRPTMTALAADLVQAVKEATGVTIPSPTVTVSRQNWTRLDEAGRLPGLGSSVYFSGTARASFPELLTALQEFGGDSRVGLQSRIPFDTALTNGAGDRFYFCILDWHELSSPDSLDEVRVRVADDVRRLDAYNKLKDELPKYEALAISDGLSSVGELFKRPALNGAAERKALPVSQDIRVTRIQTSPPMSQLNDEAFRTKVLDASRALGMVAPTPENAAKRTMSMALPKALAVVVCQLGWPAPLTEETVRTMRRDDVRQLSEAEFFLAVPDANEHSPFTYEALVKRSDYHAVNEKKKPGSSEPDA